MRSLVVVCLVASVVVAQHPAADAARKRSDALPAVEFTFGIRSERLTKEVSESSGNRLVFGGTSARVDIKHPLDSLPGSPPLPLDWVAATNGERVKEVMTTGNGSDPMNRLGKISPPTEGVCRDLMFLPLTFAARGLSADHCPVPADRLTPAGSKTEIDGVTCDEYRGSASGLPVSVWCDPAAGHTVRRFRLTDQRGAVLMTMTARASADNPAGVWLPTTYTVEKYDDVGVRWLTKEVRVEAVQVGKGYAASEFDPPWPPGLLVEDQTTREAYIAEDDGTLRHTHGLGGVRSWWLTRNWWAGLLITAGVLSAGWAVWRKRNRK